MPVFMWLFVAQGGCSSGFSVVLFVQVGGIMLLDAVVGVLRSGRGVVHELVAGCYRAGWLVLVLGMPVFLWLFVAQDECPSGFSVVLLVQAGGIILLDAMVGVLRSGRDVVHE